jgi:hypothetical protein
MVYVSPIGVAASEDHDVMRIDYKPDNSTKSGEPHEEPIEGVDDAKTHDGERTPEHVSKDAHQHSKLTLMTAQDDRDNDTTTTPHMKPISSSTPMSQDHYSSHSNSVCSYPDTSSMETTCSSTRRKFDHVYANMPRGSTTTLWDEDVHLKEMLVTQLDLLQQQAAMDKKQIREELFEMKNRIKWLEDRAMEQQVGPTEPVKETLSTPTSSQRHQRVFLQPLQQDPNNIMIPSLHPVLSQQNVWETWNRSRHEQLHQTITSVNDDSQYDPHAYEEKIDTKVKGGAS